MLSFLALLFIIFIEVFGRAYGAESTVQAAGRLMAMIGFIVFPFLWSMPEALITAELATAFAWDGGSVSWVTAAFDLFSGFLMGTWKYFTGVINNAAYPVMCADYLSCISRRFFGGHHHGGRHDKGVEANQWLIIIEWGSVALELVAVAPFFIMFAAPLPKIQQERLAREAKKPKKTLPRALLSSGLLIRIDHLIPLLTATGAPQILEEQWTDDIFTNATAMTGVASPSSSLSFFFPSF
ncbi:putative polyamine transporter At3g13620 [Wolffia australiana]